MPAKFLLPTALLIGTFLLGGLAGCFHGNEDELTSAVVGGEKPIAMEGVAPFFDGKVSVKVTVSRGIGKGLQGGGRHNHSGPPDGAGGPPSPGGGDVRRDFAQSDSRSFIGSPLPPVTLHLILTNTGPAAVKVSLIDFVSDLGNFAIEPDTLALDPGQTAEPTPMVSQLGVTADSIPFKVTLKVGGKKETRTVSAVVIAPPPPPPKA